MQHASRCERGDAPCGSAASQSVWPAGAALCTGAGLLELCLLCLQDRELNKWPPLQVLQQPQLVPGKSRLQAMWLSFPRLRAAHGAPSPWWLLARPAVQARFLPLVRCQL